PRVHVALMGMEKVIPRLADLPVFLKLLARGATGQTLSVYTTLITGPRRAGEVDGPEEFHLVILDNGRSKVLSSPFRESLQCIRCGACLNACPVYRRIGGHAYGGVYSGPIGSILTPLYDSVAENPHLPHASSLCGACQAACPVKINIPHMLIGLRELQQHEKGVKSWRGGGGGRGGGGRGGGGRGCRTGAPGAPRARGAPAPGARRLAAQAAGGRGLDGRARLPRPGGAVVPRAVAGPGGGMTAGRRILAGKDSAPRPARPIQPSSPALSHCPGIRPCAP